MLVTKDANEKYIFNRGKHKGKTLEEVAGSEDGSSYLQWLFKSKALDDFTDEAFYALEAVLETFNIECER